MLNGKLANNCSDFHFEKDKIDFHPNIKIKTNNTSPNNINNIFTLVKEIENLLIDDIKSSPDKEKDFCSPKEDDFFRSGSIDYFRNSSNLTSMTNSVNFKNQFKDDGFNDYFYDEKRKMISKNIFSPNEFINATTIGEGGYSKVIKAKHKKSQEIYAIKIFDKIFMKKEKKYYQIFVENIILNMCEHPNIINIHGCYEDENSVCLVIEYCNKGNIGDFILKNCKKYNYKLILIILFLNFKILVPLDIELAKYLTAQMIIMLEYLNSINVVHRDIKPDNIVIDKNFQLKLIDFSTATLKGKIFDEDELIFIDQKIFMKGINVVNFNDELNLKENNKNKIRHQKTSRTNSVKSIKIEEHPGDEPCGSYSSVNSDKNKNNNKNVNKNVNKNEIQNEDKINQEDFNEYNSNDLNEDQNFNQEQKRKLSIFKKQIFVGTCEYMAPEIIINKDVGIYTDLWSLGCLIYQMFTGVSPFKDKTQYLVYQNILNLNYEMELDLIPESAQDLIKSLLKIDPKERLGSGLTNNNNFDKLKSHRFFNNFNMEKYLVILETQLNFKNSKKIFANKNSKNLEQKYSLSAKIVVEPKNKERILKVGELKKKSKWFFYDKRKVVLYNTPRLDYYDPSSNILKGSICLNNDTKAELVDINTFQLKTPNRIFTFICKHKFDISSWVTAINDAIDKHL